VNASKSASNRSKWIIKSYSPLANYSRSIILFHFVGLYFYRSWRQTPEKPLNEYHVIWWPIVHNELDRRCNEFGHVNATTHALMCVHEYNLADSLQPLFSVKGDWWWLREDAGFDYLGCNLSKCKFKKNLWLVQLSSLRPSDWIILVDWFECYWGSEREWMLWQCVILISTESFSDLM
jgi:hypothetical protein